jgi:hypothetical protein
MISLLFLCLENDNTYGISIVVKAIISNVFLSLII